jgi:methionyl-tRNA synthetase
MATEGNRTDRIFIGIAWPYANGPFHIGHLAGAYLPGEIFARYHRLRGHEVLMVSGSDMHGTPTLVTAEREGISPRDVAERYHAVNKAAFERLGFTFDLFTTTHTVVHERTVQEIFLALLEHRYIDRRTEEGPYCPKHRRFLPDRYLVGTCPHCGFESARGDECDNCGRPLEARQLGSPRCSLCGTPAEFRPAEHFYLELDRLQPALTEYLAKQSHWRPGTFRVAQNFLAEGLHPTSITRDLDWGVPIPLDGYDSKRFYVWFDAVSGYLAASKEWAIRSGNPDAWRRFWDPSEPVRPYYFVGKDNKFHHTIIWPGMLLGVGGLHLPYDVPANEWLNQAGHKVSKSRTADRSAFIPSLLEHYAPDVIRFYAALLAPQNHDTELDWEEFDSVRDEILANQYGNLVQRALVLARERYGGRVPTPPPHWRADLAGGVGEHLRAAHARIASEYELVHLKEALDLALTEVREANRRFHEAKPWQAAEPERSVAVFETLWRVKALATWLSPVLPFSSAEVYRMLGFPAGPSHGGWDGALEPPPAGQALGEIRPLFPRADARPGTGSPSSPAPPVPSEDAPPLAVVAGVVRSVANHPSADKLYVLEVDVGESAPRTVVAGLRPSYPPEALRGREVALLANLAPRTIRRMTSQGMVLAADHGDRAVLVSPARGVAPGTFLDGTGPKDRTISYDEFATVPLRVGRVVGQGTPGSSRVSLGEREVTVPGDWAAGTVAVVRLRSADAPEGELLRFGPGQAAEVTEEVPLGARVR